MSNIQCDRRESGNADTCPLIAAADRIETSSDVIGIEAEHAAAPRIGIWKEPQSGAYIPVSRSLEAFAAAIDFTRERRRFAEERQFLEKRSAGVLRITERSAYLASLGALVACITHEISQSLTALKLTVDGMLYWRDHGYILSHDELYDNLRFITAQCERIDGILRNMRGLALHDLPEKGETVTLSGIVSTVLGLLGQQIHSHGIAVEVRPVPGDASRGPDTGAASGCGTRDERDTTSRSDRPC